MHGLVQHEVLRSQCKHSLHVLEFYRVDNELHVVTVAEVVSTGLHRLVQIDLAQRRLTLPSEVDPDYFFEALVYIDVLEGCDLLFYLQVVVDLVVSRGTRFNFQYRLELALFNDLFLRLVMLALPHHLVALAAVDSASLQNV